MHLWSSGTLLSSLSQVRQCSQLCQSLETIRKASSIPLLESGRQEINLTKGTLHLMQYLVFSPFWQLYTQFTSCQVRLVLIFLFSISTPKDSKDIWGTLGGGQSIICQEVASNPSHREFYPAFHEDDHRNDHGLGRFVQDQPFTVFIVPDFDTIRNPILCTKDSPSLGSIQ